MNLVPLDRDEPRYMEASAQMVETHNYVDVRFLDQPRYLQPAGIYWLEAGAQKLFGGAHLRHVAWPYRIPSLAAAVVAAVVTAYMGVQLFGGGAGFLAAALLVVSTLLTAEGRMATIDTVLLATLLAAMAALLRAYLDEQEARSTPRVVAYLYWGALGCGLMLKGPVALVPCFATPLALWVVDRRASWWFRLRPRWGWLLTLALVLPWCLAIGVVSHGEFYHKAVGINFLGKIGHGQQAHGLPFGYHAAVFLLAFWPGSLFAILALPAVWQRRKERSVRFLACWIVPHWLVFELVATKLPHYVLPTYPAIAILTAASLCVWPTYVPKTLMGRSLNGLYGVLWTLVGVALALAGALLLWHAHETLVLLQALIGVFILALIARAIWLLFRQKRCRAAWTMVAATIVLHASLFLVVLPRLGMLQLAPRAATLFLNHQPCAGHSTLVSVSYSEPSLAFLVGSRTKFMGFHPAAAYLNQETSCALVLADKKDHEKLLAALKDYDLGLEPLGHVAGLNYSNGHFLDLTLYAPAPRQNPSP